MTGRRPFQDLRAAMTPAQRANAAAKADVLRADMSLTELRQARRLTQETLGASLQIGQVRGIRQRQPRRLTQRGLPLGR